MQFNLPPTHVVNRGHARKATIRKDFGTTTAGCMSDLENKLWLNHCYTVIKELDDDTEAVSSYHRTFREFADEIRDLYVAAEVAANPGQVPANNPVAVVLPGLPDGLTQQDLNAINDPFDAVWAPAVAAAANMGAHWVVPQNVEPLSLPMEDFDSYISEILIAGAHSGFPGVGNMTQLMEFRWRDFPRTFVPHYCRLELFFDTTIENFHPSNVGAYYANRICSLAKANDIVYQWGLRHGLDSVYGHYGFPQWKYITSSDRPSNEIMIELQKATTIALRDTNYGGTRDPLDLRREDPRDKHAAVAASMYRSHRRGESSYVPSEYDRQFRFPDREDRSKNWRDRE